MISGNLICFRVSGQSFINKNCDNSRTSHDIDIKLGSVAKLDKRITTISNKLTITSCQQILMSFSIFRFLANLQQSGSRIPDAWPRKITFLLIITFYFTKTESRTKKFLTQLSHYWFE